MTNKDILEMENDNITEQLLEKVSGGATLENLGPVPWADKMIIGRWYRSEYDDEDIYYLKSQISDDRYLFLRWIQLGHGYPPRWRGPYEYKDDGFKMYEVHCRSDFPTVP